GSPLSATFSFPEATSHRRTTSVSKEPATTLPSGLSAARDNLKGRLCDDSSLPVVMSHSRTSPPSLIVTRILRYGKHLTSRIRERCPWNVPSTLPLASSRR